MNASRELRVILHTGVLFRHDAISASLLEKLEALDEARRAGARLDFRALVSSSEVKRPEVEAVGGALGVLQHPCFFTADVHVYEFGIWYEAFDTVFAVSPHAATVVAYHNVTPPELARDAEDLDLLQRSCGKKANLAAFDHIACVSEFSRDEVTSMGIESGRVSVVPLPPSTTTSPDVRRTPSDDAAIELLFVGRLVKAKGVLDLLQAIPIAQRRALHPFRVVLAGNERLSDPEVIAEVRASAATADSAAAVHLVREPDDDELAALYTRADALVLPSYHEGYCVPVVEAVSAGAHVITSDAGNLPNVVRDIGRTVPVGDIEALGVAMADLVNRLARRRTGGRLEVMTDLGLVDEGTWKDRVNGHRSRYSREAFRSGFFRAIAAALRHKGRDVPSWLQADR
jgi:glycosyltransferase involved in cell wall biosynthesis